MQQLYWFYNEISSYLIPFTEKELVKMVYQISQNIEYSKMHYRIFLL